MNILINFKIPLIIVLQIFYKISSATYFDYPYSITLDNDNIFLIQKTGIYIYDQSLNKPDLIFEFSGEEEISEENFAKIAIKHNENYILSIINDKLFIFNNKGELLYKDKKKINDNQIIYSYSLTFIHTTNDTCYYVIGYFDENSYLNLNLYQYSYKNEKNNIELLYEEKSKSYTFGNGKVDFTDKQKLLSCEYYYSTYLSNGRKILVCFYNSDSNVGIVAYFFEIDKYIKFEYHISSDIQINQYRGLFNNTVLILTKNIDNSNLQLF